MGQARSCFCVEEDGASMEAWVAKERVVGYLWPSFSPPPSLSAGCGFSGFGIYLVHVLVPGSKGSMTFCGDLGCSTFFPTVAGNTPPQMKLLPSSWWRSRIALLKGQMALNACSSAFLTVPALGISGEITRPPSFAGLEPQLIHGIRPLFACFDLCRRLWRLFVGVFTGFNLLLMGLVNSDFVVVSDQTLLCCIIWFYE
ncbi:hypothetical protein GQ457_07G008930 [Hibiscus cannabinus]